MNMTIQMNLKIIVLSKINQTKKKEHILFDSVSMRFKKGKTSPQ